jgi:hypothetical protein
MKTYAAKHLAKDYIKAVFGVVVYVDVVDAPGIVGFKFPTRFMLPMSLKMQKMATYSWPYEHERAVHYVADKVQVGPHQHIRLEYKFGCAHATIYLIDHEEITINPKDSSHADQ